MTEPSQAPTPAGEPAAPGGTTGPAGAADSVDDAPHTAFAATGLEAETAAGRGGRTGDETAAETDDLDDEPADLDDEPADLDDEPADLDDEPADLDAGTEDVTLRVWRGDADGGELVNYTLPAQDGEVVLDVVHRIQATLAPDLACRWNCKAGKCGSCSSEINGKPRLMCMTRVDELPPGPITVTPMRTFPIVRDLVTDVSFNYEVAKRVPAFAPAPAGPEGYRMHQVDIERGQEFRKCIECFLCQNVCHVIRDHEENKPNYAGPRFFIRFAELEMHPLDTNDRRELVRERMGLGMCNITKCCTEVCPEHIKITDNGIIPLKERVVDAAYDPVAWLGRKILRRHRRSAAEAAEAAAELP